MNEPILLNDSSSESFSHKAIKYSIYKLFSQRNKNIAEKSLEKDFNNRRADIYLKLNSGNEIVIEIHNSIISIKEIIERTKDYNEKGIHVLWFLHGEGNCVASPKYPLDIKMIKISPSESFLHRMYGGRVYYVNLHCSDSKNISIVPFALHFSYPEKKKYRKLFRTKYSSYFIKNVNKAYIPNWNLLCVQYNGYKIARFYDKNIKSILKNQILNFLIKKQKNEEIKDLSSHNSVKNCYRTQEYEFKSKKSKKTIKGIIKCFNEKYGKYLILESLLSLVKEEKVNINKKLIMKMQK